MVTIHTNDVQNMTLFCDFENVALGVRDAKYAELDIRKVLERLLVKDDILVKKAYCDWDRYKDFKEGMHEAAFELIEIPRVRQSGKNSARNNGTNMINIIVFVPLFVVFVVFVVRFFSRMYSRFIAIIDG